MCVALAFTPRTDARPHGLSTLGSRCVSAECQRPQLSALSYDFLYGFISPHTKLQQQKAFAFQMKIGEEGDRDMAGYCWSAPAISTLEVTEDPMSDISYQSPSLQI